nr:hypothetical protein [Tanacetum cinerariifolium]
MFTCIPQISAVTVGHWSSLPLKAADAEATRGHKGSSNIRVDAFMTLRVLVAKLGTADQLAFFLPGVAADAEATRGHKGSSNIRVDAFMTLRVLLGTADQLAFLLPGVVSQIGKVLYVSKIIISRAAGSMEAMDHALRALTEYLMIVLKDEANISSLEYSDIDLNMDKSPLSFLKELRHLKKQDHSQLVEKKSIQESSQSDVSKSFQEGETGDHGCYTRILDHMQSRTKGKQTNASAKLLFTCTYDPHCICYVPRFSSKENDLFCFCDSKNEIYYSNISLLQCTRVSKKGRQCASAIPAVADSTVSIFDVETDRQTQSLHSLELWNMTEKKRMTIQAHDTIISALAQSHVTGMV